MHGGMREIRASRKTIQRRGHGGAQGKAVEADGPIRGIRFGLQLIVFLTALEIEQVEQVAESRTVDRRVLADLSVIFWIREVVTAAIRQRRDSPVPFNELEDRDVIGVVVRNATSVGERRNHEQRNPRAIAKIVKRLDV